MNFLEERIAKDGIVKPGNVLKVDSFLNHQMDIALMDEIGREFKRRFADKKITKVLTIEASGIAIAYPVAREFGVPLVFAKKSKSINIEGEMYVAEVESFTHKNKNQVIVSKKFLGPDDHLLIIDDLGTELPGNFVTAALYNLLNERLLAGKAMIVSTNLLIGEIATRYSPQIASRLQGSFTVLPFVGKDIRLLKNGYTF